MTYSNRPDGVMAVETTGVLKIAAPPRYMCDRHGEHDAAMVCRIYEPSDPNITNPFVARPIILERNYCMYCYVEHLDKAGIRDMDPINK